MENLLSLLQSLVFPFSQPSVYRLDDWHERITLITQLSLLLQAKASEFALGFSTPYNRHSVISLSDVHEEVLKFTDFEISSVQRTAMLDYQPLLDYVKVDKTNVANEEVVNLFRGVVSVEKLAISTCALAIIKYTLPIPVVVELANIIRDECLHLLSLSRLIGIDPLEGGWITSKRNLAWQQLLKCSSALEHVMLEHCLFEGEGSFSASYTIYLANKLNFPNPALQVVKRIADEENRHATCGYFIANILATGDSYRMDWARKAIVLLREIEPLDTSDVVKFHKQTIAERMLNDFATTGDWVNAIKQVTFYATQAERGIIG